MSAPISTSIIIECIGPGMSLYRPAHSSSVTSGQKFRSGVSGRTSHKDGVIAAVKGYIRDRKGIRGRGRPIKRSSGRLVRSNGYKDG